MGPSTFVGIVLFSIFFVIEIENHATWACGFDDLSIGEGRFLASEETPVWIAKRKGKNVVYKRIPRAVVGDALNLRNSLNHNYSFPIRVKGTGDHDLVLIDKQRFRESTRKGQQARKFSQRSPRQVEVETEQLNTNYYLSLLVVMQYKNLDPSIDRKYWSIEELVLYALAFWGSVDSSLKVIENPSVSLHISGIVIVPNSQSSPYLNWEGGQGTYGGSLCQMMDYWRSLSSKNIDFSSGTYNVIAHMTNMEPRSDNDQCSMLYPRNEKVLDVGTQGPLCKRDGKVGGLIVNDDLAFDGVRRAINQIINVLGGTPKSNGWTWPRRNWNEDDFASISKALDDAWCMSERLSYFPPGKPVRSILAGDLMPAESQCELSGYGRNATVCWEATSISKRASCLYLRCAKQGQPENSCGSTELTLDGTICNNNKTKICLDGSCVDRPNP